MEEGKLNSMLEGLIAGKKKEEKNEDKKKIAEEEVADNVIQYIHMKEGGHLQYGLTFLVSQVKGLLYQLCLLGTFFKAYKRWTQDRLQTVLIFLWSGFSS